MAGTITLKLPENCGNHDNTFLLKVFPKLLQGYFQATRPGYSSVNRSFLVFTCKKHPLLIDNSFHPPKTLLISPAKTPPLDWLLFVFTCKATAVTQWWHVTVSLVDAHRHIDRDTRRIILIFFKIRAKKSLICWLLLQTFIVLNTCWYSCISD